MTARVSDLPAIATARLEIAALEPADASALAAITDDPAVTRAIHFLRQPFTLADAEALIRGHIFGVERFLGVWTKPRALIGVVGVGIHGADIEIGYWFATAYHGKGFAGEAVGAVVEALLRAHPGRRLVAECRRENLASWALLAKLGFSPAGEGHRPGRELLVHTGRDGA
jgi:RimJ/RimL family protein N-acetyltransferase